MRNAMLADPKQAVVVVIDVQEKLTPHIADYRSVCATIVKLARAADVLGVPVVSTEQNPHGLGVTAAAIRGALPAATVPVIKEAFSCWGESVFRERMKSLGRRQIILAGIEAHVCVMQTALEMLGEDFAVFVVVDAIGSRRTLDRDLAIARMTQAGVAVTSCEAMIMELQQRHTSATFKSILEIIK